MASETKRIQGLGDGPLGTGPMWVGGLCSSRSSSAALPHALTYSSQTPLSRAGVNSPEVPSASAWGWLASAAWG